MLIVSQSVTITTGAIMWIVSIEDNGKTLYMTGKSSAIHIPGEWSEDIAKAYRFVLKTDASFFANSVRAKYKPVVTKLLKSQQVQS